MSDAELQYSSRGICTDYTGGGGTRKGEAVGSRRSGKRFPVKKADMKIPAAMEPWREDAGGQAVRCKDANGKAAQRGEPHRTEDGKPAGSIRIRFERGEAVKFLSHLDLMKVFERAVRRSGLPVSYSKGFNPHPRMVLGLPLAVGMTSECEHADFQTGAEIEPQEFVRKLNDSLPDGIGVTAAAVNDSGKNIMAMVCRADYILEVFTDEVLTYDDASRGLETMLKRGSIMVEKETRGKRRKTTAKEVDIRPMILAAEIEEIKTMPSGYEVFKSAF